jgi:predicted methyltransferase
MVAHPPNSPAPRQIIKNKTSTCQLFVIASSSGVIDRFIGTGLFGFAFSQYVQVGGIVHAVNEMPSKVLTGKSGFRANAQKIKDESQIYCRT